MPAPRISTQTAQPLIVYRGSLIDVSAFYGVLNSPIVVVDGDAVGGEIFNVMSTLVGDDEMNPTYGCNLPRRVFEPINARVLQLCQQDVFHAAREWVPQVTVNIAQTRVFADASNRLVGVGVAYQYAGAGWLQNIDLAGLRG